MESTLWLDALKVLELWLQMCHQQSSSFLNVSTNSFFNFISQQSYWQVKLKVSTIGTHIFVLQYRKQMLEKEDLGALLADRLAVGAHLLWDLFALPMGSRLWYCWGCPWNHSYEYKDHYSLPLVLRHDEVKFRYQKRKEKRMSMFEHWHVMSVHELHTLSMRAWGEVV